VKLVKAAFPHLKTFPGTLRLKIQKHTLLSLLGETLLDKKRHVTGPVRHEPDSFFFFWLENRKSGNPVVETIQGSVGPSLSSYTTILATHFQLMTGAQLQPRPVLQKCLAVAETSAN
jgi:hypothetical protein